MGKKYELIEFIGSNGCVGKTYQIRALRAINAIIGGKSYVYSAGEIGGLVSGEHNLSQEGECWIDTKSTVIDNARVEGNVIVLGSRLAGNALVKGDAVIEMSDISGDAVIDGESSATNISCRINGCTVSGNTYIAGNPHMYACEVSDKAKVVIAGTGANECEIFALCFNKNMHIRSKFDYTCIDPIKVSGYTGNFKMVITVSDMAVCECGDISENESRNVGIDARAEHEYSCIINEIRAKMGMK